MTLEASTSRVQYATNGTTGPFTVPFYFLANDHIRVVYINAAGTEVDLALDADYSVTGAGNTSGGTVTLTAARPSGGRITIVRSVPFTQLTDYRAGDRFPAESHEQALDKLTMEVQQIDEVLDRAIVVGVSDTSRLEIPGPDLRANTVLSFDGSGNVALVDIAGDLPETPVNRDNVVIATEGQTVLTVPFAYTRGNNSLQVVMHGELLEGDGIDYTETSTTTITLTDPAREDDEFTFLGGALLNPSIAGGMVSETALGASGGAGLVGRPDGRTDASDRDDIFVDGGRKLFMSSAKIQELVNWNVNATDRELHDTVLLKRAYEGQSNTSGYFSGGSAIYSYLGYGFQRGIDGQKASGTTNALTGHINVWAADNGTGTGRTEIVPLAGALVLSRDYVQAGTNLYNEFSVTGPRSASAGDREGFLSGATILAMTFAPGNTLDASHDGAYGATITTRPGEPGFGFENRSGDRTYTMRAGLAINGWAGLLADAPNGYDADAAEAYDYGVLIGGLGGSLWLPYTAHSKIGTGIGITDYTAFGIDLFTKHPNAVSNSCAIRVNADAGPSIFGFSTVTDTETKLQAQIASQFGSALRILPSSHVTSERAGAIFGDWVAGQDADGNGTKDFFLFDGSTMRFRLPATGGARIAGLPSSSAGLPSGSLWYDAGAANVIKYVP